jgi:hypothetical protein
VITIFGDFDQLSAKILSILLKTISKTNVMIIFMPKFIIHN